MATSYAVQLRRPDDFPRILRQIASRRGRGKPYVIADLLRDCLIAYTADHVAYQKVSNFEGCIQTTVYVRGTAKEHEYYLTIASNQNVALGHILEAAIIYHCGDDIETIRAQKKVKR